MVKAQLCLWANLAQLQPGVQTERPLVYRQTTSLVVEQCLNANPQMANLWTPESNYSVRTSMYNRDARSQSVSSVTGRRIIDSSANSQERDRLQAEYNKITQVAICFVLPHEHGLHLSSLCCCV